MNNTWSTQLGSMSRRTRRLLIAVTTSIVVVVLSLAGLNQAQAATPDDHFYVSFHGLPTYTVTVRYFDKMDVQVWSKVDTAVGGKKFSYAFNPDKAPFVTAAYIRINSGVYSSYWTFLYSDTHYDHCFLIGAGGSVSYTGDNTTGCDGK